MDYWKGSSSEDEDGILDSFRRDVLNCIDEVEAAGVFATGDVIREFPNPGISIDGSEPISVPLSKEGAQALAGQSCKAPFGKNGETLVDESVRKTWEIGAERISFRNAAWPIFVNKLIGRVAHELGVAPAADGKLRVRAELYKNLLYEPGAMFKAHKDTEKVAGMFGTLVICLPSQHTGGAVCLQHAKQSVRLSTEASSTFDCFYLAWYADVSHEIETVKTGHRWVLTYNLINDKPGSCRPSATALDYQTDRLVQTLSRWYDQEYMPHFLAYPLEHQYTARYLDLHRLKGHDYQRTLQVATSCARHGSFYLFLAEVGVTRSWGNEESIECEGGPAYSYAMFLRNVSSLDGVRLSRANISLGEELFLGSMASSNREPDSRTGGEYLGNQYADFEETYSDRVMVIVPQEFVQIPLVGHPLSSDDLGALMAQLREIIGADAYGEGHKADMQKLLLQVCDNVFDLETDKREQKEMDFCLGHVAVTAAILGDEARFHQAVMQTQEAWTGFSLLQLGKIIDLQDPSVKEKDLITGLTKGTTLGICARSLVQFYQGFRRDNPGREDQAKIVHAKQWYIDRLVEVFRGATVAGDADTSVLLDIVSGRQTEYTAEQREVLDEEVISFLHKFNGVKSIVNEVMVKCVLELQNPDSVRRLFFHRLLSILLEPAISAFDLNLYYHQLRLDYPKGCPVFQDGKRDTRISNAGPIRSFYDWAAAYSEDAASRLLWKLQMQASKVGKAVVQAIFPPLMGELIPSVNSASVEGQHCFQSLVKTYIVKAVDQEPSKPRDWARPAEVSTCSRSRSGCEKCRAINAFLEDPTAEQFTLDLGSDEWHVEYSFNSFRLFRVEKVAPNNKTRLTKTFKGWENRHRDWEIEAGNAAKALWGLPQDRLRELLGDQYETLMGLGCVRCDNDAAERGGAAQSPDGMLKSAESRKHRRSEGSLPPKHRRFNKASTGDGGDSCQQVVE